MEKLDKKIEQLEYLHRVQRQNAENYFSTESNNPLGHFWQNAAKATQSDIAELRKEKRVIEKWQKIESTEAGLVTHGVAL